MFMYMKPRTRRQRRGEGQKCIIRRKSGNQPRRLERSLPGGSPECIFF